MSSRTNQQQACRQFHYESRQGAIVVKVLELLDPDFGLYVWPSALVLAEYISYRLELFQSTSQHTPMTILELGAGTALPSLLLAKATDSFLVVTDRPDVPQILDNVREALRENGVTNLNPGDPEARVMVRGLDWGDFTAKTGGQHADEKEGNGGLLQLLKDVSKPRTSLHEPRLINVIIGSDVFYNPAEFDPLVATVSYIINRHNPDCVFLTTYQDRSAKRNIDHLLRKWGLEARIIAWEDFGFDMTKFIAGDAQEVGEGIVGGRDRDAQEMRPPSNEKSQNRSRDSARQEASAVDNKEEGQDARWLRLAREEVERAMIESLMLETPSKARKVSLVDYSSGSESEEDIESKVGADKETHEGLEAIGNIDREEPIGGGSDYRLGDGGTLSSVHLLWICKRGRGGRFEEWRSRRRQKS